MKKIYSVLAIFTFLFLGFASGASAYSLGVLTDGSQANASNNINYYVSQHSGASWEAVTNSTFNATGVATLASTYDVLILPWYVNTDANLDWATRILPYMEAGGGVLWEDPYNVGDLAGSGITFGSSSGYTSDRSLVPPFDANGAESYYHVHFGIPATTSAWDVWSTDSGGNIHGVYGEFGDNEGRMVLGVSDNLYHPNMSQPSESDHYNLLINELNWLGTGSVLDDPTDPGVDPPIGVPEPATMLLLGSGLIGLVGFRRKKLFKE